MHGEASFGPRAGGELPAEQRDALAHPHESVAAAKGGVQRSPALVEHVDADRVWVASDVNTRRNLTRVLDHVGQGLLDDAKYAQLQHCGQAGWVAFDDERDRHSSFTYAGC
jgi:hypothetical protein